MTRWIVTNLRGGERLYQLPGQCSWCHSRDITAEIRQGFVAEQCSACDRNRQLRLVRVEEEK
mgnify:CR=1 FL=1